MSGQEKKSEENDSKRVHTGSVTLIASIARWNPIGRTEEKKNIHTVWVSVTQWVSMWANKEVKWVSHLWREGNSDEICNTNTQISMLVRQYVTSQYRCKKESILLTYEWMVGESEKALLERDLTESSAPVLTLSYHLQNKMTIHVR